MSTPKRVPAGTPVSGQFAPDQHAESEVSLPAGMAAETAALSQQLNDCYVQRDDVNARISRISARLLATQVAAKYPSAATVVLDTSTSDDGRTAEVLEVLDADGKVLLSTEDPYATWEEQNDLIDWDPVAGGIALGRAHTEEFLDDPEWKQVGITKVLNNSHGRVDIDKALRLR